MPNGDVEKLFAEVINRHSLENDSNTPDWILGQFITSCLVALNTAVQQRETWYGRDSRPTQSALNPGMPPTAAPKPCGECDGKGGTSLKGLGVTVVCPSCNGSGKVDS